MGLENRKRRASIRFFLIVRSFITALVVIVFFNSVAFAWGPITHTVINFEAAKSNGQIQPDSNFVMGGHSPDMISIWHIITSKIPFISQTADRYDYGHNLISSSDKYSILDVDKANNEFGISMFGKKMLKAYKLTKYPNRFTTKSKYFTYGWIGHQLADKHAHGYSGYASTKETFSGLPFTVKLFGNHGAAEFIVDAIIFEKFSSELYKIFVPSHPALIHEGAIRYYNEVKNSVGNHSIVRKNLIICDTAKKLARIWSIYLAGYQKLVKRGLSRSWFPEAKEYYSDYVPKYNQSVAAVADFLENPTYEIASADDKPTLEKISLAFASLFDRLKAFFSQEKVQAEESQDAPLPETLYYTFINDVAEEAERLGALEIREEIVSTEPELTGSTSYEFSAEVIDESAFTQALTNVINRDLAQENPLETGLWAKFMEGLYLKDDFAFREIITRAQDFTPPAIGDLKPGDGSFTNNPTPFITATVTDDPLGIGLDLPSITMKLDGEEIQHTHIPELNLITYTPSSLPDGEHTIILEVSDKADNQASKTWSFTIDTVPPEIEHTVQNKIINIKKETTAKIDLSANEPVNYTIEIFRVKEMPTDKSQRGEIVYLSDSGETFLMNWEIEWDGTDNNGASVPNGVYTIRIIAQDRAGNESSFEEQVNVNNAADGI